VLSGSPVLSARAAAISAAGSKPRIAERMGAVGTGTIVPLSSVAGASHWMRSAISSATGSRRRNLRAATSSRATSSCGAADQARSSPGAPAPVSGSAAASRRAQRLQITTSDRQLRPQAAQSGGMRAVASPWKKFTRRSLAGEARAWRAKGQTCVNSSLRDPRCRRPGSPLEATPRLRAGSSRGHRPHRRSGSGRR
jgi:hypothetical protein